MLRFEFLLYSTGLLNVALGSVLVGLSGEIGFWRFLGITRKRGCDEKEETGFK